MGGKEISKYEKAASIISSARINKTKLREIDKDYRPVEESESYRIQNLVKNQMSKKRLWHPSRVQNRMYNPSNAKIP